MNYFTCNDCGARVPPEWKASISANTCPGCGGKIMSDEQQELIAELGEAMQKMPNDPVGVAGWIIANFSIKKIGEAEPVEKFHDKNNKVITKNEQPKVVDKVTDFFKRSGINVDEIKKVQANKEKLADGGDITDSSEDDYISDDYENDDSFIDDINGYLSDPSVEISDNPNDSMKSEHYLRQKRIQQLESQKRIANGGGSMFRRSS